MPLITAKINIDGIKSSAQDLIQAAFNRGVTQGRILEQQNRLEWDRYSESAVKELDKLKVEHEHLKKRFSHLMESAYIASFDEYWASTGEYKRDIAEADRENAARNERAIKKAEFVTFNPCDSETYYRCPDCKKVFGDWLVYTQSPNENGTKDYCPNCKAELDFGRGEE